MARFTTDELWHMYTECEARDENPRYANLAKRIKYAIENNTSFRIRDVNDFDYLCYALFPNADADDAEFIKFCKKFGR